MQYPMHPATAAHFEEPIDRYVRPFEEMAKRIRKIDAAEFAGAIVVVPPDGEPISILLQSSKGDLARFWGMASTEIGMRSEEEKAAAVAQQDPWARR
jgi:hypothetical protein